MARAGAGLGLHVPAGHRRLPVGNLAAAAVGNLAEVAAGRTLAVLGNYSSVKRRRRVLHKFEETKKKDRYIWKGQVSFAVI